MEWKRSPITKEELKKINESFGYTNQKTSKESKSQYFSLFVSAAVLSMLLYRYGDYEKINNDKECIIASAQKYTKVISEFVVEKYKKISFALKRLLNK